MLITFLDELTGLELECSPPNLAPYGQGYTGEAGTQGCAIQGATPGSTTLSGTAYLDVALRFYQSHMWRNLGIILALWIFFVVLLMINIERLPAAGSNKAVLLYKRGGGGKFIRNSAKGGEGDEEQGQEEREVVEKPGRSGKDNKSGEKSNKGKSGHDAGSGNAENGEEDQTEVHADDT